MKIQTQDLRLEIIKMRVIRIVKKYINGRNMNDKPLLSKLSFLLKKWIKSSHRVKPFENDQIRLSFDENKVYFITINIDQSVSRLDIIYSNEFKTLSYMINHQDSEEYTLEHPDLLDMFDEVDTGLVLLNNNEEDKYLENLTYSEIEFTKELLKKFGVNYSDDLRMIIDQLQNNNVTIFTNRIDEVNKLDKDYENITIIVKEEKLNE